MKLKELRKLIREELTQGGMYSVGQEILNWEQEISAPESVQEERERILQLKTWNEAVDYYINERGWDNAELLEHLAYFLASKLDN